MTSLRVSLSTGAQLVNPPPMTGEFTGGAEPSVWLGAPAIGGLTLPAAMPTANQLYAPRATWLDNDYLIAADTGNHRVLIWDARSGLVSHSDASVILGQGDANTEGAQAAGRGPENGMRLPTGVLIHDGRLVVADAWNHRLLVWDSVPHVSDTPPDHVIGQADPSSVEENRGGEVSHNGFYWPFGIAYVNDRFWVADTGNRRILAWDDLPEPDEPPVVLIGQDSYQMREENRGECGPNSFRWPHDIAGNDDVLFIADAGNHRVLGWQPPPVADRPADTVLAQPDFSAHGEFPYGPHSASTMRFPYAIDVDRTGQMAVADTANNRILLWDQLPTESRVQADRVLGQPTFATNGENRWDVVSDDTFCWPYGICLHIGSDGNRRLAVADSGNNRVMVWNV
ncbi:MAG: NHL repeat-containing protein, partial [Acidimicrobiales bacterium]